MTHQILELVSVAAETRINELADILVDAVRSGASVSFMSPFDQDQSLHYWQTRLPAIATGDIVLLGAIWENRLVGTVQLDLVTPPNQHHRANVAKLLVHRDARRRGIGRALMQQIEQVARSHNRHLLVLDTMTGSAAEALYRSLGYMQIGIIPNYAYYPNGTIGDTTFFYKPLIATSQ